MISLLVVDDEITIRNSIEEMVLDHYPGQFTVYQAENGLKAVELVCSIKVDLIITDIKMPVCTGLEMLEKLHSVNYNGEVIVVSGFDDYALVRQAMKSGAVDYLLKPIESAEFFSLLDTCIMRLQSLKSLQNKTRAHIDTLEETLYKNQYTVSHLFNSDPDAYKRLLEDYPINHEGSCMIALFDIFQKGLPKNTQKKAWALEILEAFPEGGSHLIQGEFKDLWVVIYFYTEDFETDHFIRSLAVFQDKQVKVCHAAPCPISGICSSFQDCLLKLEQMFFDIPEISIVNPEPFPCANMIKELLGSVGCLDFENTAILLQKFFYQICHDRPPVDAVRQTLSTFVYSVMQKNNAYIRIISNYKFTENDVLQVIQNDLSASHLKKELIRILDIYISEAQSHVSQRDDYYIQKAKEYIGKNYSSDITLTSISEHLNIHPNYFSSLFKKKAGISYTQFLRQVRIEAACRLIKNTTKKFYEIAELSGYHDTVQFNRAFREETGMSPSAYRSGLDL